VISKGVLLCILCMKVQFVSKKEKYKKGNVRKNIETLARNISLKIILHRFENQILSILNEK